MAVLFTGHSTILAFNGIKVGENLPSYATYDKSRKGCNKEDPIVIPLKENYVRFEYDILDILLNQRKELAYYDRTQQELFYIGDKSLDCLTVNVIWIDRENDKILHSEEKYWFDITEGIHAAFR